MIPEEPSDEDPAEADADGLSEVEVPLLLFETIANGFVELTPAEAESSEADAEEKAAEEMVDEAAAALEVVEGEGAT
jgi:hypothetical protein